MKRLIHITPAPGSPQQESIARNLTWFLIGAFTSAGILTIVTTREIDRIRATHFKSSITYREAATKNQEPRTKNIREADSK